MPFTKQGRKDGRAVMDAGLTPLARALRRFNAGGAIAPKATPIAAVNMAVEQRDRLREKLEAEGVDATITDAAIVLDIHVQGGGVLERDPFLVVEGRESDTVHELEDYSRLGHQFAIHGITFAVRSGEETRIASYRINRTPEGDAALKLAGEGMLAWRR